MKALKSKKILSLILSILLLSTLVFSATASAKATTTASGGVDEVKKSILQVRMVYQPSRSDLVCYFSGTSFLINDNTILTCAHVFNNNEEKQEFLEDTYGPTHVFDEKNIKRYEVVVNGGLTVPATLKKMNNKADYSILTLNETVKRPTVKLGVSKDTTTTQQVYTLGFPNSISDLQDSKTYSTDQVSITSSTIANKSVTGGVEYISHNAKISKGNSGGPLVDEEGNVIGVNLYEKDGYYLAAAIDQVKAALEDLDIQYTPGTDTGTVTDETAADKEEEEKTTEVENIEPTTIAVENEGGMDITRVVIIAVIAVLVIVIIIVIILIILSSKKKKTGSGNGSNSTTDINSNPINPPVGGPPVPPTGGGAPYIPPTTPTNEGAGETSVLNDGAGETTVLGVSSTGFNLLRKRNNEKINLNKPEFIIGKERRRVDYCISDNSSISRQHAKIKIRGGRAYITDLNSTNCTYVNGTRISPNQEVILSKGDSIKISDEEFEFLG